MAKCLKGKSEVAEGEAKFACKKCGALTADDKHVCSPGGKPGKKKEGGKKAAKGGAKKSAKLEKAMDKLEKAEKALVKAAKKVEKAKARVEKLK